MLPKWWIHKTSNCPNLSAKWWIHKTSNCPNLSAKRWIHKTSNCPNLSAKWWIHETSNCPNLSEEFDEVVDVSSAHRLSGVPLVLKMVLARVWSVHT